MNKIVFIYIYINLRNDDRLKKIKKKKHRIHPKKGLFDFQPRPVTYVSKPSPKTLNVLNSIGKFCVKLINALLHPGNLFICEYIVWLRFVFR